MTSSEDPSKLSGKSSGKNSNYSDDNEASPYDGFNKDVSETIKGLARTLSHTSSINNTTTPNITLYSFSNVAGTHPFSNKEIDPRLDPESDDFDSKLWVMNMKKLSDTDPDYYKPSSLGVVFKNLNAYGEATDADYQSTFLNALPKYTEWLANRIFLRKEPPKFNILKPMDGYIKPGELCVVLGKPGSGCTTFLKSISTQTHGFHLSPDSELTYDGLSVEEIHNRYRGDVIYCAETEKHFPNLSVGETLKFAARMRTPQNRPEGVTREMYVEHITNVIMATYGLSHTKNTNVGNDFIRGVSGGERKRVSICEAALSGSKVQCWDNSTRGLDSATALEFVKALKTSAVVTKTTPLIAIYQCSQMAYDLFDKVQLLYEGYQIYFGDSQKAKDYFIRMGYECPQRQTTADFLTSITSTSERKARPGFENKVPRTPKEFYNYWMNSSEHESLLLEIEDYKNSEGIHDKVKRFKASHVARQSRGARSKSPFTVSYPMQIKYIMHRDWLRIKGDPSITLFTIISQTCIALITCSIFYNLRSDTGSFFGRIAALYFAIMFNAFGTLLEIFSLYEARPIVEKHKTYALYHPSADALASVITEMPTKICVALTFNLIFYFMVNLKREAGAFFFYLLVNFTATITMSHLFRTVGSATKSLSEAMTPAAVILLASIIFTGFVIPTPEMLGWCRWINYLDPIAYSFESLVAIEFHGRNFDCSQYIPSGPGYPTSGEHIICSPVSSVPGRTYISGDEYIEVAYKYRWSNAWRNWAITLAFALFFLVVYIFLCEYNKGAMQKGEILLFQKKHLKNLRKQKRPVDASDVEIGAIDEKISPELAEKEDKHFDKINVDNAFTKQKNIFHWRDLTYEVNIKSETRVILNQVSGYVKPGTVTALMGASGAGKTTLLNTLSARLTTGVITSGTRMVNGRPLDNSFERSIGYVQQQDLHLQTSTVREALIFSAELRQPNSVPKGEKINYVNYVIKLLEMEKYADAVVGVEGEGLNVEQRKRLTIGVELAAKPDLLIFLDEPTSGLDSQTAWAICQLIRKLADHGQAILCTIHQPSAILIQQFDRLLFLQKGGETVYFGELGANCQTMIKYFEKYGAQKCPAEANPAEWMLEVIGAAPGSHANQNYHDVWKNSTEYQGLQRELDKMEVELSRFPVDEDPEKFKTYAAPLWKQYVLVTKRVFEQTWRSPRYTYSKFILAIASALFNGFVFFKVQKSLIGLQSQMFSVFIFCIVFTTLNEQYLPNFVFQRDLYEVRERPSRTFSWVAFITAQITSEIPWQIAAGTISFFCWYYPIGLYNNAAEAGNVHGRGALMWVAITLFYIYSSTMAQLCISFQELADNAANLSSMLFTICLTFCGVMATPEAMPGFWIFMYRCNPFTYLVNTMLSSGLADSRVTCSSTEYLKFSPPDGMTCQQYMSPYMKANGGYLLETTKQSTSECSFCTISDTNSFLNAISINPENKGRDIGIFSAFIFFNIIGTVFLYWLARVPKGAGKRSS